MKKKKLHVLVIHGPNLNLLGAREPKIYGKTTLSKINQVITKIAEKEGVQVSFLQSNHEGELVDVIGKAKEEHSGILINPAAYTHTSVAIRDALSACGIPAVEVHLSNIYSREEFRHHSITAPACVGQVTGFREHSYVLGFYGLLRVLKKD